MSNLRLALTDKNLIGLPLAHDRPYIARDTDLGGFFVVIGKTSKTFTIQADLHGEDGSRTSIRMAVGEVGAINSRDARAKAKALIGQIGKGEDPRPPKVKKEKPAPPDASGVAITSPDGVPTLREAWGRFKVSHLLRKKRAEGTLRAYTDHMERLFADWLDRPLSEFGDNPLLVTDRHDLITEVNGPAIANGAMRSFRAVYRHARRTCRKLPAENPVSAVDWNPEHRKDTAMGVADLPAWFEQLAKIQNPIRREFHLFLLLSGSRPEVMKNVRVSTSTSAAACPSRPKRARGRPPLPVVLHPEPLWPDDADPQDFADALAQQMKRHGDTAHRVHRAVKTQGGLTDRKTISEWRRGLKTPHTPASLKVVGLIEVRYRLAPGRLVEKLKPFRASGGQTPANISVAESRRLAWHLPEDFRRRSRAEQAEILDWVRTRVLSGGTDYSRYHSQVSRHRFGFRFDQAALPAREGREVGASELLAPRQLSDEMQALVRFKSATLTDVGYRRSGVWGAETAAQRGEHLALMFGALAADPTGEVRGLGVPADKLTFGLLALPAVWDWYIRWREERRGFFTRWEAEMLLLAAALTREEFGWLRQNPWLADRLKPIPGLVSAEDIEAVQTNWDDACQETNRHSLARAQEVLRVARVHRDPFEPILPILEAESPVREYLKIADEVLRRMPDERHHPRPCAESARAFLMLRLGLHLGVRQKNLRQLLVCRRGDPPRGERELERLNRGELRWTEREAAWEVFIPCAAFKNANSAYFSKKPFRLRLPDLGGLYAMIDAYLDRHRALLLGRAADPGVLFIKTVKTKSRGAAYSQTTFYEAWRLIIQRYGIYNPWTGRGAIEGLLPHGPHSVRDVLATHVLKATGSYEQASYAIQDTAKTVAEHYGRFLPQDKAALAAKVLDAVWLDS